MSSRATAKPREEWPKDDDAWRAKMEERVEGIDDKLDLVLGRVLGPSGWEKACQLALGKDGGNVKYIAATAVALAVLAVALWGASASVSWGDLTVTTGEAHAAGATP